MDKNELKLRTKNFGLRMLKLVRALPRDVPSDVVARQLCRAALSVASNYRAACRARSRRDFVAKLGVVLEEVDECGFWLEIVAEDGMLPAAKVKALLGETNELAAIIFSSIATIRSDPAPQPAADRLNEANPKS